MITLKTVLVAIDFSDSSDAALERGRALAGTLNASLHLLHVVSEPLHESWSGFVPAKSLMETVDRLQAEARQRLLGLVTPADRAVVATAWGEPSDEILDYARNHAIDLIVCGTHGRRGWDRLVMGSVAERIARLAACPVLTVHAAGTATAAA